MTGKKLTNKGLADVFKFIAANNANHSDGGENVHASELLEATKFDSPAVIVVGLQSCGKSALLSRLIGGDILPSAAGRCTKNLTEITLIHDSEVEHHKVEVRLDGDSELKEFDLDFDNVADHKKVKDFLDIKAKKLADEAGEGVKFIKKTIYVSITSKKFESNLILVDIPGMVEVDLQDPTADSRQQIIDIIREYKEKRRTIALCCHDASQNLDTCTPLRLLKMGFPAEGIEPLDPSMKDTFVVLTKVDKIKEADEIDENVCKPLAGSDFVPGSRMFATNCSKYMHTSEQETAWFSKQSYYKEKSARLGCGNLKTLLTDTVTDIINNTVVPKIMGLISKRLLDLQRQIEEAQKTLDAKSRSHPEVMNEFQKWVQYFYQAKIVEADAPTSKLAMDLQKMYKTKMVTLFEDLYDRLVRAAVEVNEEDEKAAEEAEEEEPMCLLEQQAQKFIAGTNNPGGFVTDRSAIVEELCRWLVRRYQSDDIRKTFLDEYLLHIKKCLDQCIELSCGELPGMNEILTEYVSTEFEKMREQFQNSDERIYKVYSGPKSLCPFQMMTATADNPKGQTPSVCQAAGNISQDDLFRLFVDDSLLYMQSFTNKAKLDTNAILIHDAVLSFCGTIDSNCFEALRKALAPDGNFSGKYTYENVALNDQSAKATETVAALKSEQEKITAFKKTIDNALQ